MSLKQKMRADLASYVRTDVVAYVRDLLSCPPLLVWALFIFAVPFYIFDSGLPQPGDWLMLVVAPTAMRGWDGRLSKELRAPLKPLFSFLFYVTLVNYSWMVILGNFELHGKTSFLLFPVYYLFNTIVFLSALVLYHRFGDRFLRVTFTTLFVSVFLQAVWSVIFPSARLRNAVFFNNANQLGYYALLAACVLAVCQRRFKVSMLVTALGMMICVYLALLSASRAAAGGIVAIFIASFLSNPKIILAALPILGLAMFAGGPITKAYENTQHRVRNDQFKQYTFFEERGLGRLQDNPQYMLLGAAEGGTDRFKDGLIGTHEIHSTPLAILFAYGVVGLSLFMWYLWRVVRGAGIRTIMLLAPVVAFSVAHVGLRDSMLWVLLACFTIVKRTRDGPVAIGKPKLARQVSVGIP